MLKKIIYGLIIVFVVIQFFRPTKNISDNNTYHISTKYGLPENVQHILKVACYDCHSNKTEYPWYAQVQPSAWFLNNHVVEGKDELNFSEFTNKRIAVQNHKLEEMIEVVDEKEMPLASYTYFGLHKEANLTEDQRLTLVTWFREQINLLKTTYPNDSLILKKKKK